LVAAAGLESMSYANSLTSLRLHWSQLRFLRRVEVERFVDACPLLDLLCILTFHNKASRARRLALKQLENKAVRRWINDFLSVDKKAGLVVIHLDWIRKFNEWKGQATTSVIMSNAI